MNIGAMEAALRAARAELRSGEDIAQAIAAGIDAYERERPIESVHLLQPAPGDMVVFRVRRMTGQEFDEFTAHLQPLHECYPEVLFTVCEGVEGISVMRPLQEMAGKTGLDKLREVANRPMGWDEFDERTKGEQR